MGDLFDAIEGKPTRKFWPVYYKDEKGKTRTVEIQADSLETAFAKAEIHYPDSARTLIVVK